VAATSEPVRAEGITVRRDVTYGTAGGVSLLLDEYLPGGRGLYPALIALHGGGWWTGDKADWDNNCRQLAQHGFACFSVNYRLAPRFPYPAAVEDVLAAVRWVRDHADKLGVDPTRLGAIGSSAGGHLAAMVGVTGSGSTVSGTRVNVVVAWSGVFDFTTFAQAAPSESTRHIDDFLGCDVHTSGCQSTARQASPVTYLDPTDPPTFVANSTTELVPLAQPNEMANDLQRQGIPHQLVIVPGDHHGTALKLQAIPNSGQTVFDATIAFLNRWIGATRTEPSPSPSSEGAGPTSSPSSNSPVWWLAAVVFGLAVVALVGSRRAAGRRPPRSDRG
jgi:acetyl esterase/lipase